MTIETLTIASLGHRGDGCAETADGPLYVPFTLPGEVVEVQPVPGKDRAELVAVLQPSPDRVAPPCPHFGVCGGCALQHVAEPVYRAFKRHLVVSALAEADLKAEVEDLVPAHGRGRRRATFHARHTTHDVLAVGFMAARAHRVVPISACPILDPALDRALKACWALAEALVFTDKPLDLQVTATEGGLDIDIRGAGPIAERRRQDLVRLAGEQDLARLTLHGELIVKRRPPVVVIGRVAVELPPGAFLQATAAAEAALAALVIEMIGTLPAKAGRARPLRRCRHLRAAAGRDDAGFRLRRRRGGDQCARQAAARGTQGLKPVIAETRDLFRRPLIERELDGFRAVVFDPPRQGAEAQAKRLAASRVPVVVAVSCNPSTFARDAALLVAGGYRLVRVVPVDQFLYSPHVEVVARFER